MTADRRPPTAGGPSGEPTSRPPETSTVNPGSKRDEDVATTAERRRLRRLYLRVLSVQVVTLVILWLLQARFGG